MNRFRAIVCHSLLAFAWTACTSSPGPVADAEPDTAADVTDVTVDATDVPVDSQSDGVELVCDTPPTGACCCEGDVTDFVVCSASGLTCRAGYSLYFGDDCRCLPDRDTPCCLPHVDVSVRNDATSTD